MGFFPYMSSWFNPLEENKNVYLNHYCHEKKGGAGIYGITPLVWNESLPALSSYLNNKEPRVFFCGKLVSGFCFIVFRASLERERRSKVRCQQHNHTTHGMYRTKRTAAEYTAFISSCPIYIKLVAFCAKFSREAQFLKRILWGGVCHSSVKGRGGCLKWTERVYSHGDKMNILLCLRLSPKKSRQRTRNRSLRFPPKKQSMSCQKLTCHISAEVPARRCPRENKVQLLYSKKFSGSRFFLLYLVLCRTSICHPIGISLYTFPIF